LTPVVIDASAGVELLTNTVRGHGLRSLLPADTVAWVPELFYVECGAVLRRMELHSVFPPAVIEDAVAALLAWPLRITDMRALFRASWQLRSNLTFADATYVALADQLGAPLLTDDGPLTRAPNLPVRLLHL
jgi:predicted nucleic acid-binding protein